MNRQLLLPLRYRRRLKPKMFTDNKDGVRYQHLIYDLAAGYCAYHAPRKLIDVGCGAGKFDQMFADYVGIDLDHHPTADKMVDLEQQHTFLWSEDEDQQDLLFVCADVIEHLVDPLHLLGSLIAKSKHNPVLISTPDRARLNRRLGPPGNPCHAQEWTQLELHKLLNSLGAYVQSYGHVRAHDRPNAKLSCMYFLLGTE